ncbi:MAG: hypothetical protein K9L74_06280 [Candidatus Izimaplasma sp.]|nr:hypothetical protein [Candidatus Izimaplasma bacterium]
MIEETYQIDQNKQIMTIIGLIFEGIVSIVIFGLGVVFGHILGFIQLIDSTEVMPPNLVDIFDVLGTIFVIWGALIFIIFIVNLVLFTKLIKGKLTKEQAHKLFLYQAIYGGFNMIFNQITGLLYLITGITGYQNHSDFTKKDIRGGI